MISERPHLCTGCGLCKVIFPDVVNVVFDEKGHLVSHRNRKLTLSELSKLSFFCPGVGYKGSGPLFCGDDIWGNVLSIFVGCSSDDELRFRGSSGGSLRALALYAFANGHVQHVVHVTRSQESPLLNEVKVAESIDDIRNMPASLYSPCSPLERLNLYEDLPGDICFIGRPCDVYALRRYLVLNPNLVDKFKIILSFFCAGTPSLNGTKELLKFKGIEASKIRSVKYRGDGWPGKMVATANDGSSVEMSYEDTWGKILNKHLPMRCKYCFDGIGGFADIVVGDAWRGDKKGFPSFVETNGQNVIISRTQKGDDLLDDCVRNGALSHIGQLCKGDLKNIQPYQFTRRTTMFARCVGLRVCSIIPPKYPFLYLVKAALKNRIWVSIKAFIGTVRRGISHKL